MKQAFTILAMEIDNDAVSPRVELIRKYFTPSQLGAEIGPFHSPICPKTKGYNCLVVDAFSREQLLKDYADDPYVMERVASIEEVDIVTTEPLGEALTSFAQTDNTKISSSKGCLDYIVSSHNIEHQPNPIRFLQDAEQAIRPGGYLVMAIPIASRCFDCFQPLSRTGEILDAYYQQKTKPTIGNAFDHQASSSKLISNQGIDDSTYNFNQIVANTFNGSIDQSVYQTMKESAEDNYLDSHCWRFNPYQFELIFCDLTASGLIQYLSISELITNGSEFIVYLRRSEQYVNTQPLLAHTRTELMKQSLLFQFNDLLKDVDILANDDSVNNLSPNEITPELPTEQLGWKAKAKRIIKIILNKEQS